MAFKMKGSPMQRNFGIGKISKERMEEIHGPGATKTEAQKLAERRAKRREEGKPVGLSQHLTKAKEEVAGHVGTIAEKTVGKAAGAVGEVVSRVGKKASEVKKTVQSRAARNRAWRKAVDAWRAKGGNKSGEPMPKKKDF